MVEVKIPRNIESHSPCEGTITRVSSKQRRGHSVTRIEQSIKEPDGYRMDVTVWFRHKNEITYYVDSAGHIHGPMDCRHSTQVGAMDQSTLFLPGSSVLQNVKEEWSVPSLGDKRSKSSRPLRRSMSTLEHSSNELDRLLNELQQERGTIHSEYQHYQQTSSTSGGQTLSPHRLPPPSGGSVSYFPLERGHGSLFAIPPPHGNPRSSSSQARYTTRITRDHHQKTNSPVTVKLDASGLQDNTFVKTQEIKTVSTTNREKRLVDELLQARQEIAQLKRTSSLMDHPIYSSNPPPHVETTWNSSSYSKRMEMKQPGSVSDFQRFPDTERQRHNSIGFGKQNENERRLAAQMLPKRPQRTMSSTQMHNMGTNRSNRLFSESSTFERRMEQPTTTYSAHQENMRMQHQHQHQQQSQQEYIQQHTSTEQRYVEHPSEVFEEIETITLQPIGKGVQDLESSKSATMPRTPGAATPMSHRGGNTSPGFATLPSGGGRFNQQQFSSSTTHMNTMQRGHHQQYGTLNNSVNTLASKGHQRGGMSRQNSAYDRQVSTDITHRHQTSHNVAQTSHGQHLLTAPNPHSRSVSVSSFTEAHVTDGAYQNTLRHVQDTSKYWYQPTISREETINQLKYQVPGSFIVRDSTSFANAFGLAVKVAALPPRVTLKTNDLQSELVRHYLIEPVGNKYVRLKGFEQEPVFPTLAALIHQHVHNALALPVRLVLPNPIGQGYSNLSGTADYAGVEQNLTPASPTTQASFPFTQQDIQQGYISSHQLEASPLTAAYLETHQQMTPQTIQSNTLTAVTNAYSTSTYEVLYLGSYDVDFTEGHRAVKVAIDHVLRYVYTNGKHVECQMELSAMEGITLVDVKKRLFMKRTFPPNLISYCGFDPKNREYSIYQERKPSKSSMGKISCFDNLFRPIETKSHRVFAFIVRKAGPTGVSHHEGTCYVLAETGLSQSAALIVKDVLRTLQSQQISSSSAYAEPLRLTAIS